MTRAAFYHGGPGLEEPVEAELWRVADALAQLVVHALLVEAQLVEHADEEAVLLLRVVLAFVGAVGDAELMERGLVATDLGEKDTAFDQCLCSTLQSGRRQERGD